MAAKGVFKRLLPNSESFTPFKDLTFEAGSFETYVVEKQGPDSFNRD